ncbi:MAG: FtsX-like permease family protein [bacterium]
MSFTSLRLIFGNFRRNLMANLLNLTGLAVGLACTIVIGLYVHQELNYDRHWSHADRLYRVVVTARISGADEIVFPTASAPVAPTMARDIDAIDKWCRLWIINRPEPVHRNEISFLEENVTWADSTVFDLLDLKLIQGDAGTALTRTQTAVIDVETAKRYFPGEDPVGKEIVFNNRYAYTVTGVYTWIDKPTHFPHPPIIASFVSLGLDDNSTFLSNNSRVTLFLLKPGIDPKDVDRAMEEAVKRHDGESLATIGATYVPWLQSVTEAHLDNSFTFNYAETGNRQSVMQFIAIALFILVVASLNYVNLSTAVGAGRAKQVGVSRTFGATRGRLIRQFLTESVLLAIIALMIALLLVKLALPAFSELAGRGLQLDLSGNPQYIPLLLAVAVVVGLLAGVYPAFFLSSWKPVQVLKGDLRSGAKGGRIRSILVVTQFAISATLIIGALVIQRQTSYLRHRDIGFDRDHVLVLRIVDDDLRERSETLRHELLKIPGVLKAAATSSVPTMSQGDNVYHIPSRSSGETDVWMQTMYIGHDFLATLEIPIAEGRNYSPEMATDSSAYLLNEAAVKMLGWQGDVIGKEIDTYTDVDAKSFEKGYVVGVVKDFNFKSLHSVIEPLIFRFTDFNLFLVLRLSPEDIPNIVAGIKDTWRTLAPTVPLDYTFLDDSYDQHYRSEIRLGGLFRAFTVLAIFIASLGLFALAAFAAQQRTKEIGVRKVMGATPQNIIQLLVTEFVKLVAIANLVAWPVAGWLMHRWLENFPYRVDLGIWVFAATGGISLLVALATVSLQALRAALINPARALRYE